MTTEFQFNYNERPFDVVVEDDQVTVWAEGEHVCEFTWRFFKNTRAERDKLARHIRITYLA